MNRKTILLFISFIVLLTLACNATFTVGFPTPTVEPAAPAPTAVSVPTSQPLTVSRLMYEEVGQNPDFTIKAEFPAILDNTDPGVSKFNRVAHDLVQAAIDEFKRNVSEKPIDPNFSASFLDVKYTLTHQAESVLSIKFDFSYYLAGAAHPGDHSLTLNYDLGQDRELVLDDLFVPNSNHLEIISQYCIAELGKRDIGFTGAFEEGAEPTAENYRNWNILPEGLMVTFDTYQVAPGAAGPQVVLVPYDRLEELIDPQGALAGFIR